MQGLDQSISFFIFPDLICHTFEYLLSFFFNTILVFGQLLDYKSSLALPPFILEVYLQIRIQYFVPVENKKENRKKVLNIFILIKAIYFKK